jgi:hypothetical protein
MEFAVSRLKCETSDAQETRHRDGAQRILRRDVVTMTTSRGLLPASARVEILISISSKLSAGPV